MRLEPNYWSTVLTVLAEQYLMNSHATCIIWHSAFDINLRTKEPMPVVMLHLEKQEQNLELNDKDRNRVEEHGFVFNEWILRLTVAIEQTHCESFIVFQEHIPLFARYFYNASTSSIWRSAQNYFIFVFTDELLTDSAESESYTKGYLFQDQPQILLVHSQNKNASIFQIQTNHFVGLRFSEGAQRPQDFYTIQIFDAKVGRTIWNSYSDLSKKLKNLQGREIVLGIFDYEPFMFINYVKQPAMYDRATKKAEASADGTEVHALRVFCELYNCTLQMDTSEKSDWGDIYANATGIGLMGMVLDRSIDYGMGGMYIWYDAYQHMDMTTFLGRSGVTCLVPAPQKVINWALPLRPFQATLWLSVVFCLVVETLALTGTRHFETFSSGNRWHKSLLFGVVSTLKLFVNQSTAYVTTSYALRTALLASYIVDIILTTVYGGGLAAILTLPKLEEAADSRQRLYEHKLIWTGTSHAWVRIFDVGNLDHVLYELLAHYRVNDADVMASKSRTEQMGFVVERMQFGHVANAEMIPDDALPRLKLMVDDIYFSYTVGYVPRLWPFVSSHNDFILMWHSSGLDKYWEWKIVADNMNVNRQNGIVASQRLNLYSGPVKLGIDNFIGVVMLWCFGMTFSLLVFVGELCLMREYRV